MSFQSALQILGHDETGLEAQHLEDGADVGMHPDERDGALLFAERVPPVDHQAETARGDVHGFVEIENHVDDTVTGDFLHRVGEELQISVGDGPLEPQKTDLPALPHPARMNYQIRHGEII